jgi:hypothetical protein
MSALYIYKSSRPLGISLRDFELGHLYRRHRQLSLKQILSHPSLATDCKIASFMVAVGEYLVNEVRSLRHPLVDALEAHGKLCHDPVPGHNAEYYKVWWEKFPEVLLGLSITKPSYGRDVVPLPSNALSDKQTLPYCIKCFRNRFSHRRDGIDQQMEEALGSTTSSYVAVWRRYLERLFCDTWAVISSKGYTHHFPCMFDQ